MFPTPANMFWSISAKPTDLRELENLDHSVSGHASSRSGSCPSFCFFAKYVDSSTRSTVIAESSATIPWPSSLSRVFAVTSGAVSAANTPNLPLIPKCTCTTLFVSARFDADASP